MAPKKPPEGEKVYFRDARFDPMARRANIASNSKEKPYAKNQEDARERH